LIANITKGSFLKPLLAYNDKKVSMGEAVLLSVENTITNSKGENGYKNAVNRILELSTTSNRKDKFFHVSINFPEQDKAKIDNHLLQKVANDYMQKLGFDDMPYLIYKHDDTNHPHIHIVACNINENKKAIVTSNDRIISQKATRELELKYDLTVISSKKGENIKPNKETRVNFNSLREELNYHIKYALNNYKVQNIGDLEKYLKINNLELQVLNGNKVINGKEVNYHGVVFNRIDVDFKRCQKGIKASSLNLKPTVENLEKIFKRNEPYHKSKKASIKNQLDYILSPYDKITMDQLKKVLLLRDIKLNDRYDSNSKLVGISFENLSTGYKYTGEQISKKYTAKNLADLIGEKIQIKPAVITEMNYKKVQDNLENLNINQKIQTLIYSGFKVNYQNNQLSISDYKNKTGGYIIINDNININTGTIELYKQSKNIEFNNLSNVNILQFEHSRAKLEGDTEKEERVLNILEKIQNPRETDNTKELRHIKENLDDQFQDNYVYQINNDDDSNKLSDIDKNARKKRKPGSRNL
jgi:hypothetical protein